MGVARIYLRHPFLFHNNLNIVRREIKNAKIKK